MGTTTTANLPSQDLINIAGGLNGLTGADRIDADAIKAGGTYEIPTIAKISRLDAVLPAGLDTYFKYVIYEEKLTFSAEAQKNTSFNIDVADHVIEAVLTNVETELILTSASTISIDSDDGTTTTALQTGLGITKNSKSRTVLNEVTDPAASGTWEVVVKAPSGSITSGAVKVVVIARQLLNLPNAV